MITSYTSGLLSEWIAATFLRLKLYTVLYKRYKTPVGEIDLICKKNNTIVFFEVKYRKNLASDHNIVHNKQVHRIKNAALFFMARNSIYNNYDFRFDLLIIKSKLSILHYQNVW